MRRGSTPLAIPATLLPILAGSIALLAVGCESPGARSLPSGGSSRTVMIFAAASTVEALEAIGAAVESREPGLRVRFNFAGSQQLASQILAGAPADVYVSANSRQMRRVVDAGLTVGQPEAFAGNRMALVVEPANPRGIRGLADLSRAELTVVVAADEVPAGAYARRILDRAEVDLRPDSREPDVRHALARVTAGEADAAIVYASDAEAAGDRVTTIPIRDELNVDAGYSVAVLREAADPAAAGTVVEFLRSASGRQILWEAGFTAP